MIFDFAPQNCMIRWKDKREIYVILSKQRPLWPDSQSNVYARCIHSKKYHFSSTASLRTYTITTASASAQSYISCVSLRNLVDTINH